MQAVAAGAVADSQLTEQVLTPETRLRHERDVSWRVPQHAAAHHERVQDVREERGGDGEERALGDGFAGVLWGDDRKKDERQTARKKEKRKKEWNNERIK